MGEKEILLSILEEQRKTNELLQTIFSSKEQSIVKINKNRLANTTHEAIYDNAQATQEK